MNCSETRRRVDSMSIDEQVQFRDGSRCSFQAGGGHTCDTCLNIQEAVLFYLLHYLF